MGLGGGRKLRRLRWFLPPPSRLDRRERRTAVAYRATRQGERKTPVPIALRGSHTAKTFVCHPPVNSAENPGKFLCKSRIPDNLPTKGLLRGQKKTPDPLAILPKIC